MSQLDETQVVHPSHYNNGKTECWDEFVQKYGAKNTFVWLLLTAQKYFYRAGSKEGNSFEQDIAKAGEYIKKANELRYNYRELDGYNNGLYNKTIKEYRKYDSNR